MSKRDSTNPRIFLKGTGVSGNEYTWDCDHLMINELKIKGVFANLETLGVISVKHDHCQHVDHGWVHRYVLLINGIVLAERMIKSDVAKAYGGPVMSGAAEIGRVVKTVHKAIWKHGALIPEITGGDGHEFESTNAHISGPDEGEGK